MVDTNNLKSDGTTMIMSKYKVLVNQLKAKRFKRTSIFEILARNDLSNYINSKRIDFLEIIIDKDAMLDRRGLHLNFTGHDKVARSIFKHSVTVLN